MGQVALEVTPRSQRDSVHVRASERRLRTGMTPISSTPCCGVEGHLGEAAAEATGTRVSAWMTGLLQPELLSSLKSGQIKLSDFRYAYTPNI
jgi:hypothetical protein